MKPHKVSSRAKLAPVLYGDPVCVVLRLRLVVGTTGLVLSKGQLAERELARTRRSVECDVSQVLPQARRSCAAEGCTSHEKTRRTRRVLVE